MEKIYVTKKIKKIIEYLKINKPEYFKTNKERISDSDIIDYLIGMSEDEGYFYLGDLNVK